MAARQDALQYNRTRASRRHLGSSIEALGIKIDPGTTMKWSELNSGNSPPGRILQYPHAQF